MASLKAIVAAADRYNFMQDGAREGVVLAGPLGSVAAWDDGTVETSINQPAAQASSAPYWACHAVPCLEQARHDFALYAKL